MNINNILTLISLLASIGMIAWIITLIRPVINQFFKKLEAETKNTNLLNFEKWVQQAVNEAETALAGYQGSVKKDAAISMIAKRIEENGLAGHFSDEAISGAIEQMVKLLPKTNAPAASVPTFGKAPESVTAVESEVASDSQSN